MRFEMKMPDLATTDSVIRIGRWIIEPGQKVERGQPLLEVETDKAAVEVESVVAGVLLEVRAQVDDEVSVGATVRKTGRVVLVEEGPKTGSVSAEIAAGILERFGEHLRCPIRRVASADVPAPFSPVLENAYRPDVPRIVRAADLMQF